MANYFELGKLYRTRNEQEFYEHLRKKSPPATEFLKLPCRINFDKMSSLKQTSNKWFHVLPGDRNAIFMFLRSKRHKRQCITQTSPYLYADIFFLHKESIVVTRMRTLLIPLCFVKVGDCE